jgi:GNAT superfamily N-acetyltransferase
MTENSINFDEIIIQHKVKGTYHFSPGNKAGSSIGYDDGFNFLIPIYWTFWGITGNDNDGNMEVIDEAIENDDFSSCARIGSLSGHLIMCEQLIANKYDPLFVCDDYSADLEYVMSALTEDGCPLSEEGGKPRQNVLYIHELEIEENLQNQGLGSRIIQELPYICRDLLHVAPKILAYFPSPTNRDWKKDDKRAFALRSMAVNRINNQAKYPNLVTPNYSFTEDEINIIMGRRNSDSTYPEELKNTRLISFYQRNGFQEVADSRLYYQRTKLK